MKEITVKNYIRNRNFGWGYSFTPTGENAYSIEVPAEPDHEGTVKQIFKAQRENRTWQVHSRSAFYNTAWFYGGKRILQSWVWGNLEPYYTEYGEERQDVPHGYHWVWGLHFPEDDTEIRIRVED